MIERSNESQIHRVGDEPSPVFEDRWLKVFHERVRFPNGDEGEYNRLVEGKTGKGVVCVPVSAGGTIGFVRVFRYPLEREVWEVVRGYADSDDLPAEAHRELAEEMGYASAELAAAKVVRLGSFHPNSGLLTTEIVAFAFLGLRECNRELSAENGSIREARFLSATDVTAWIQDGTLTDAMTLATIAMLSARGIIDFSGSVASADCPDVD